MSSSLLLFQIAFSGVEQILYCDYGFMKSTFPFKQTLLLLRKITMKALKFHPTRSLPHKQPIPIG